MIETLTLPELKQLKLQKVMQRNQYRIERNHKMYDGLEIEILQLTTKIEKLTKNETTIKTKSSTLQTLATQREIVD